MNAATWILLAAGPRGPGAARRIDALTGVDIVAGTAMVGVTTLAIVLLVCAIARGLRLRQAKLANSPWRLFAELAAAHQLNYRERQLATRLARQHQLIQPAILFVEPACWDVESLGPSWRRLAPELAGLRDRIFAPPAAA